MDEQQFKNIKDKALINVTNICNLGGCIQQSSFIPKYVEHSFNRILFIAGERFGWEDKAKLILKTEHITKDIDTYLNSFIKAHENLIDLGIEPEHIHLLSPVLILDTYVAGEHSLISSLTISKIYSFLSLAKLCEALELLTSASNSKNSETDRKNALIEAQSHLLIAFESSNRAVEIEFESKTKTLSEYFSKDEEKRLIELEEYKQKEVQHTLDRKSGNEKRSVYWRDHKEIIRLYLSKYDTFPPNKKDNCIYCIQKAVSEKIDQPLSEIRRIGSSTFYGWLENYNKYGKPFI